MRAIALAMAFLFLGGCGITAPQNLGHQHKFTLSSISSGQKEAKTLGNLMLDFPKANTQLDTYRIALLRKDKKRDYFANARWADFLPSVVQSTMVESLQNSGYFTAVTADHSNFSADYQLQGDIKTFEADYTKSSPPIVVVKVNLNLIDLSTLKIIKSFTVKAEHKAKAGNLSSIHDSFDIAFSAAQKKALKKISSALKEFSSHKHLENEK